MTEINTFSAVVDDAITRSGRPDRKADIIAFVRSSIRECQVKAYFRNDFIEDTLTADAEVFIWSYPQEFRMLRTVRYPITNMRGEKIYPPEILPGKKQREHTHFYYGGPGYYAFAGLSSGLEIDVAYYKNSKKLPYYESAARPATFSLEADDWTYLTATTDADKLIAREAVSNWLLFNYYDTILEGTLAKLFKVVGDERASSTYALYKSFQNDLIANEPSDSLNK
jgi:hypothetical protein